MNQEQRAREKQEARDRDARDLESGRVSREELRRRRGAFAFPDARIIWDESRLA